MEESRSPLISIFLLMRCHFEEKDVHVDFFPNEFKQPKSSQLPLGTSRKLPSSKDDIRMVNNECSPGMTHVLVSHRMKTKNPTF